MHAPDTPPPPKTPRDRRLLHQVVEWLLAAGVDPNIRTLSNRATALELAILEGCHQAIQALRWAAPT
jgi:hypothetical protein